MPQCICRRIRQIFGRKGQGTSQGPLPINLHSTTTGHPMGPEQFCIVHKEVNNHSRTIKEAMFICVQDPTLNINLGKYQLLHIWDNLLQASPTLQHKPSSLPAPHPPPKPLLVPLPHSLLTLLVPPPSHCP